MPACILDEVRARRWTALAQRWADETDEALVTLATAEERAPASCPTGEPSTHVGDGDAGLRRCAVLIGADRADEALGRAVAAGAGFRVDRRFRRGAPGRPAHAELLLRRTVRARRSRCCGLSSERHRRESAGCSENGAWLLSEVLEALGRDDEADGAPQWSTASTRTNDRSGGS